MNLYEWAAQWGIPLAALEDLKQRLGYNGTPSPPDAREVKSESTASKAVRLEAAKAGVYLWRNNVGAVQTENGQVVRFGLCNESKAMNERFKSSDLIGVRPVVITPAMVGQTLGQFIAREVKKPGWKYTGTDREEAQLRWMNLILALGCDACFANGEGSI